MIEKEQIKETLSMHGYEYQRFLGKGSFSSVILCQSTKYNQNFAIKIAHKDKLTEFEYSTMISLNHPNIIKLYDAFEDEFAQYLVMEYCSNGTIRQKGKLSYEQFVCYAKQILDALSYCHSKNVAHRDIKPDNIFVDQYDQVKLADFGMAKKFQIDSKCNEKCGSLMFFAPEMIQNQSICPFKADIWALGITFFYMTTGKYPFKCKSREELKQLIFFGELDFDDFDIHHKIRVLITKMTTKNINLRFSADDLLKMSMFSNEDQNHHSFCHNHNHKKMNPRKSFNTRSHVYTDKVIPLSLICVNTYNMNETNPKTHRNNYILPHPTFS